MPTLRASQKPCLPTLRAKGRPCEPLEARPRAPRRPRRARRYADALRTGRHRTEQQLGEAEAEAEGLAQAYVSQILGLLRLSAPLLDVACDPDRDEPVPALPDLLEIARVREPLAQVMCCRAVIARLEGR